MTRPPSRTQAAAELTSVSHAYGKVMALQDVTLTLPAGKMVGLLGPDGVGKSTLMGLVAGAKRLQSGAIETLGGDMSNARHRTQIGRRLAFMPQGLGRNLYHDLSLLENLEFFGKLFGLDAAERKSRITGLTRATGLYPFLDRPAGKLSGGMKQKVGLCAALIHDPDFLLLDEPTTGVDPQARDAFWDLLLELAHRDGVTIFISTHFMDEGMRYDRISLMHAGQVLITGEPQKLIEKRGAENLEEAFIAYISDVLPPEDTSDEGLLNSVEDTDSKPPESGFSLRRLLAYTSREAMQVRRDPVRLAFSFIGSAILLLIMSFGISQEVRSIPYAVYDLDQTPESRVYLSTFGDTGWFEKHTPVYSADELDERMKSGELALALQIPPDFGRNLRRGETAQVAARIDGTDTQRAGTVESYVSGAHNSVLTQGFDGALALDVIAVPRSPDAMRRHNWCRASVTIRQWRACRPSAPRSRHCCCCCFRPS